jgi:Flp pilus assembly protein TadG
MVAWGEHCKRVARDEEGGSMIEMALTFTGLMTFVMALMEICILFYTFGMISECAREGTRWASVRGSTCQTSSSTSCTATIASIQNYVLALGYPNPGGGALNVTASWPGPPTNSNAPGSPVKVDIKYTFPIRFPFVPKNSLALETYSQMYILQ